MRGPSVTLAPLSGSAINDMILDYMALSGENRRAELAHFLESSRSVQGEIMATTLRGMILRASA